MQPGQQAYQRYRCAEPAAVFMSARLVVGSCAEMAAEADIGHYMQQAKNTPHCRDTLAVLGNENKTQRHWFIALC